MDDADAENEVELVVEDVAADVDGVEVAELADPRVTPEGSGRPSSRFVRRAQLGKEIA